MTIDTLGANRRRIILAAISEAAQAGRECPSNAAIALKCDASDKNVQYQLRQLRDAGSIKVEFIGSVNAGIRVITIIATGERTAAIRLVARPMPKRRYSSNTQGAEGHSARAGHATMAKPVTNNRAEAGRGEVTDASRGSETRPAVIQKSLNPHYKLRRRRAPKPTSRDARAEELRQMAEHAANVGVLRVVGELRTVWTNDEAVAVLTELGLKVKRSSVYTSIDGKKVLTNKLIAHANLLLQQRQTVRVRVGQAVGVAA